VSNVIEIGSSGSADFSKEAMKAIKKWKYTPAMENGEPIQQCVNTVQMDFRMRKGGSGVRKKFKNKYTLAIKALESKNFTRVEQLLVEMKAFKYRHIMESNLLHTVSATYAEAKGDRQKQLFHLSHITFSSDDNKKQEKYQLAVLNQQFGLAVSLNMFREAYRIYSRLKALEAAKPHLTNYEKAIKQIDDFVGSEQDFVVKGNIDTQDYWRYSLARNTFSLTDINGAINKLDVRCANKRHVYTVENNNTWHLPNAWKNCSVFVYGTDNTSFKLIEHPKES